MTPDERNLLGRFLQDLAQARGGAKDADAAAMIDRAVRTNPDAGYLLVQHALLADQALHDAQDRIAELERASPSRAPSGGSFLGGAWGGQAQPAQPQGYAPQGFGGQGYGALQPPVQAGGLGGLFGGGGGAPARTGAFGSFLRQAGTTAAGVAGGEMLFSGLSGLFGGHHGGGFGYGGGGPETVIVNDYGGGGGYGPDGGQGGFGGGYDDGGVDDGGYDDGGVG